MEAMIVSGQRRLSHAALQGRVARAAGGFDALGLAENDAVALLLRNDFAFFEAALGAVQIGAYAVPINWHFTGEEVGYILADCQARVLVVHADLVARLEGHLPKGIELFVVPTPPEIQDAYGIAPAAAVAPPGATLWDDWLTRQPAWTAPAKALRSSMIYTSGTTGRPKGVRRAPATSVQVAKIAEMVSTVFDMRAGEALRTVISGPMYHSAPNLYGLSAARNGGHVVLQPRFDAEGLLRLIEAHRISHVHMVPVMFVRLLKLPAAIRAKYDLSSLRFVVHAAAPCPAEVKRAMVEWWGPVINEYYGATETGALTFHDSAEALAKPGTVGRPTPGARIEIHDPQGRALPVGEIGEVYGRLDAYPDFTYQGREAERADVGRGDLVTCGDVGYFDADGYLFLCDRARDMVISGGVNIYPAEIEAVLVQLAGVRDCAVFGIPDDEFGEALMACIEPDGSRQLDAAAVREHLGRHLAGYKMPRRIEFRDALPREDSGKIFKRRLRDPYWQDAGRRI
ncbi:MAG: acyl-CoA synthetase [Alphaproteobacteria bacterium]|jgi:long-chain acyl-CoA synthetase|nr:acyl-CoA synthetase [Alphaproteobacteria bacterium]